MVLKESLRQLLKVNDMTVAQLARKTKIPKTTVADWLNGASPKDITQVKKVADAFKISLEKLCFGSSPLQEESVTDIDTLLGDKWISGTFEVRFRRLKK